MPTFPQVRAAPVSESLAEALVASRKRKFRLFACKGRPGQVAGHHPRLFNVRRQVQVHAPPPGECWGRSIDGSEPYESAAASSLRRQEKSPLGGSVLTCKLFWNAGYTKILTEDK